jgi:hypothetical protein
MKELEKFNEWMRTKVKSIYYADHAKMVRAYEIILQN